MLCSISILLHLVNFYSQFSTLHSQLANKFAIPYSRRSCGGSLFWVTGHIENIEKILSPYSLPLPNIPRMPIWITSAQMPCAN
jgi:hypothetical protein